MTLVAAMFAVCASAQIYVGGNVGIASYEVHNEDETVYSILPEVGYKFNDNWAAGVMFGWSKGGLTSTSNGLALEHLAKTFEINPYKHYNGGDDVLSIGLKPGVELKLDKFSLIAHVGFIGYQKDDNTDKSIWGMDFNGNNIMLGVYYNF